MASLAARADCSPPRRGSRRARVGEGPSRPLAPLLPSLRSVRAWVAAASLAVPVAALRTRPITLALARGVAQNRGVALVVGVDVGGTFTDCVLSDGHRTWRAKSPTTPADLGDGVLAALALAAGRRGASLADTLPEVARFGLGTTAVTNVLAAGTGLRVGLLTTAGFEEMLAFARGARVPDADGWLVRPGQIVAPGAVVGIHERIDRDGAIVVPLDPAEVEVAARDLVADGAVEAIAVSFLWSFLEPAHEDAAVAAVQRACPGVAVVSGAALHPVAREYERTTFAVLNAYVSGALAGIDDLAARLRGSGLRAPLLLVHSGGGSITPAEATRRPLLLAVSGPAAGVAAAGLVADAAGAADVVTCDMGGTSFDVSVVVGGSPVRKTRGELHGVWTALSHIDVESIGAGGGSLGWVDARGMLRVGPRSSGSDPGPACYGRGGTGATVTDALVVLGYLDPDRFLGGDLRLDADAAHAACAALGAALGLDAAETAWGIRELALAGMVRATRARTGALGLDPRDHALLSFGGSGALFTPDLARAVGAPRVLVPELASVLSAFGAASADVLRERVRAAGTRLPADPTTVIRLVAELAGEVDRDLAEEGIDPDARAVTFEADLRFAKQSFELRVPVRTAGPDGVDTSTMAALVTDFHAEYARRYGHGAITLGVPVELVALRAIGTGRTVRAPLTPLAGA
ncbi:MAG: hydantoinase/oxoprolinase family protein, partial [Actinobacteria bacterium]|nr:hydantoinase/oxoprolinase family protein [Actinomycetota bacterium]